MIILGDISCPTVNLSKQLHNALVKGKEYFKNQNVIFNLEGLLSNDEGLLKRKEPLVFNHPNVFNSFKKLKMTPIPMLANNHTLDFPHLFEISFDFFEKNQIKYTGAFSRKHLPIDVLTFKEPNKEVTILNYCWDFLLYHQKNPTKNTYVSVYNEKSIIEKIRKLRNKYPKRYLMVYFHWNFDLEVLPFPSHRSLSKALIDNGANLIVGCHSHCIQGGEKYKNGFIIYGLGNYFFPNNMYANGRLRFPIWAAESLSLEVNLKSNEIYCHWSKGIGAGENYRIEYLGRSKFENCRKLKQYSPYQGMDNQTYISFFKRNRRKRKLIPIFKRHDDYLINTIKLALVKTRGKVSRKLASLGILNWQN